jgi:TPR repeat protein
MKKIVLLCILMSLSATLWGQDNSTRRIFPWEVVKSEAAGGNIQFQLLVARVYLNGSEDFFRDAPIGIDTEVEADATQAAIWVKKAARQGAPYAQGMLGAFYSDGTGVERDGNIALYWLEKAVRDNTDDFSVEELQGLNELIIELKNDGYDSSRAIIPDTQTNATVSVSPFEMIKRDADRGISFVQLVVGQIYMQGSEAFPSIHNTLDEGVEREGNLALYWLERAFQNENGGLEIRHLASILESIKELRAAGYSSQSTVVEEAIRSGNLQPQQVIDNLSLISIFATDDSYGHSPENPINVGGLQNGPLNQRIFLSALAGPNGEEISFQRIGNCCPFATPNGFNGQGFLDKYEITYEGLSTPIILYLNLYDSDVLKVPVGFTLRERN